MVKFEASPNVDTKLLVKFAILITNICALEDYRKNSNIIKLKT